MSGRWKSFQDAVSEVIARCYPDATVKIGTWINGPDGRRELDVHKTFKINYGPMVVGLPDTIPLQLRDAKWEILERKKNRKVQRPSPCEVNRWGSPSIKS